MTMIISLLQKRSVERFRCLAGVILLNLGKCLIQTSWLQIPKKKDEYGRGTVPHNYGFTHRHVDHILNFLIQQDIIYLKKGAKYKNDPQLTAIQPTELFEA